MARSIGQIIHEAVHEIRDALHEEETPVRGDIEWLLQRMVEMNAYLHATGVGPPNYAKRFWNPE